MREEKSEEQLTKDLEAVLRKLYNRIEGTDEEKRKAIDEKVKTSIQSIASKIEAKQKASTENIQSAKRAKEEFIKAAMENPDADELAKMFGYNRNYAYEKMKKLGICTKTQIVKIIKEQWGKKSDDEIAQETHVSPKTVKAIRKNILERKKAKQSGAARSRRNELDSPKIKENNDDIATKIRLEVSEVVAEVEGKKAEGREKSFVELATNLATREQIQNKLRLNEYDIILLLRKYGILSREDVERLIETTNMSDEEIAKKSNTSIKAVANVRKVVDDRESLISKIPENQIGIITRMIKSQNATSYIKDKTRVSPERIDALKVKILRDKDQNIPETAQRIEYNKTIMSIRYGTQSSKDSSVLDFKVSKILALYERFLTPKDKALIAYAYLQCNCYLKSIEFSEKYLGLTTPTTEANKQLIKRIIDEEAQKEEATKSLKMPPTNVVGEHEDR